MKGNLDNDWISFSDIMTGLMIIFLFISISYMMQVKQEQEEKDEIFKQYQSVRTDIYHELDSTFKDGFEAWNLKINPDLSIQITDASACFPIQFYSEKIILKENFKAFLNEFTPKFLSIILNPKYNNKISEIRIEGHTGIYAPDKEFENEYYRRMIVLSQKRSNKVLDYMINLVVYDNLQVEQKDYLRFIFSSNGLAFGKSLDENGVYRFYSKQAIDKEKSMRVEFKIVTNSEDVIKEWFKKTEQ